MTDQPYSAFKEFWAELRRRRVIRTTITYIVVGYLFIEAASVVFPLLLLPEWTVRAFMIMVFMGLPIAIVLAWIFDIDRPGDRKLTSAMKDRSATESQFEVPPIMSAAFASVAVLPFENLSPDKGNQYLADGIATELHSTLVKVHRLRVAARTSAFAYSGENIDVKEIARKLNVQFLISGSVRRVDDHLRITIELDNAIEGVQIWSETYDRDIDDIFTVQQDIAYSVTSEFGGARLREEIDSAAKYPTANLDAWSLVQRARSYVVQFTPNALSNAVLLLRQAVDIDDDYTAAHAALASALAEQILNGLSADVDADSKSALESADRAFSQSPRDPFVLKMCGAVWAYFGRTDRSLGALRSAVDIAPFDFGSWGYMGWPLAGSDDGDALIELHEIMERILRATPHHPGVPYWHYHQSVAWVCSGDDAKAVGLAKRSVDRNPTFPWTWMHYANVLGATGAIDEGNKALARCVELSRSLTTEHYETMVRRMTQVSGYADRRVAGLRNLDVNRRRDSTRLSTKNQ